MIIYDLCETYHSCGKHEFKILLDKSFKNGHDISIKMLDPENNSIDVDVQIWGRKINCSFIIDDSLNEGVYVIKIKLDDLLNETIQYWVIK